jgi:hypothetical protein
MLSLFSAIPPKRLLIEQLPAFAGAWVIAEFFYKFHSFSLECAGFLLTWAAFEKLLQLFKRPAVRSQ